MKEGLSVREEFLKAAFVLAKSSPMAWYNFIAALDAYTKSELERGLGATTDETMVAVGMSRRLLEIRNQFRDIEEVGHKLHLVA